MCTRKLLNECGKKNRRKEPREKSRLHQSANEGLSSAVDIRWVSLLTNTLKVCYLTFAGRLKSLKQQLYVFFLSDYKRANTATRAYDHDMGWECHCKLSKMHCEGWHTDTLTHTLIHICESLLMLDLIEWSSGEMSQAVWLSALSLFISPHCSDGQSYLFPKNWMTYPR